MKSKYTAEEIAERTDADVSPRLEMLLNQRTYVGIWVYSGKLGTFWSVEISGVETEGWLEDGVRRVSTIDFLLFDTFEEALKVVNDLAIETSKQDNFSEV